MFGAILIRHEADPTRLDIQLVFIYLFLKKIHLLTFLIIFFF